MEKIVVMFGQEAVRAYIEGGAEAVNALSLAGGKYTICERNFKNKGELAAYLSGLTDCKEDGNGNTFCFVKKEDLATLRI